MADPLTEVAIRLRLESETKGAQEAAKALDEVEREAKQSGAAIDKAGERAAKGLDKASAASKRTKKGSVDAGGAVLEFSRAFEDLQYGIRGVINNIPVLAQRLGAGAGLAGGVSLLVVGLDILRRKMLGTKKPAEELGDELEKVGEASEDAAGALAKSFDDGTDAIERSNVALRENLQLLSDLDAIELEGIETGLREEVVGIEGGAGTDAEKAAAISRAEQRAAEERARIEARALDREERGASAGRRAASETVDVRREAVAAAESQLGASREASALLTAVEIAKELLAAQNTLAARLGDQNKRTFEIDRLEKQLAGLREGARAKVETAGGIRPEDAEKALADQREKLAEAERELETATRELAAVQKRSAAARDLLARQSRLVGAEGETERAGIAAEERKKAEEKAKSEREKEQAEFEAGRARFGAGLRSVGAKAEGDLRTTLEFLGQALADKAATESELGAALAVLNTALKEFGDTETQRSEQVRQLRDQGNRLQQQIANLRN